MSLTVMARVIASPPRPRVSGDEPAGDTVYAVSYNQAPRERG